MVDFDPRNDTVPKMKNIGDTGPAVSALKTAIAASGVAASYPAATMHKMTYNDLLYVVRSNNITVVGLT